MGTEIHSFFLTGHLYANDQHRATFAIFVLNSLLAQQEVLPQKYDETRPAFKLQNLRR